ncbi:serine hydroxymethyltransferase [Borreliella burgdorferi]|uniref:Serine hydroxymethyltransferase n=3 Tax=Borreliella burgdorferi TaxID=139 RepID=GLYA_BORBU|nr:serine hydroxymethyltransferase [Borreliella burgdorferi]B7J2G3.1 RecName: Full=Serine hydroxymethyltransferase; Short=SHMT; Short=Serine methylase [Borreliella burgdorferi ZS7]O51547.1 RecName: Full=Serine hydroxymethyltransferase; Short=SHMT; Short=Serine methylase [Borreliella burgdorferi B31]AGS66602.1 serine hydroxymethyltransferase [Borreliella burgdorferi CA382]AAC66951.1 serine hydroxymethyltransferase [Borreliella burgdorferi B31]ACK74545.1 serine hydroxymethyltransferase [Borrelie
MRDDQIFNLIEKEKLREREHIELIASENFTSLEIRQAVGSILTNKYAEGYPLNRYYGGCSFIDEIETLAISRAKELFGAKYANVQPHSGSQANMAAIMALISPGDRILGMQLSHGGHLTHGSRVNFSGIFFNTYFYGVSRDSELIDYDEVLKIAKDCRPNLIIAGASSYSREIDFKKFREIADDVSAYLLCDIAHIAGLIVAGFHNSSIDVAHLTTSTTHKTLRGPRGGIILSGKDFDKLVNFNGKEKPLFNAVNSTVFPGTQGGPLVHVIAGKAIAFKEALQESFKEYIANVIKNTKVMAEYFKSEGFRIVSGGTDNHLFLVDLSSSDLTGADAEKLLESVNITLNKNAIPFDKKSPSLASGIRIGGAAITSRGLNESDSLNVAKFIVRALKAKSDIELKQIKKEVVRFIRDFDMP